MILLVSVSARMLAELAVRDGYDVVAVDRFGDLDLQRPCPSVSILRDLGGQGGMAELVDAAERIPSEPSSTARDSRTGPTSSSGSPRARTLLGCAPDTLRRVRDPALLGASLRGPGSPTRDTFSAVEAAGGRGPHAPLAAPSRCSAAAAGGCGRGAAGGCATATSCRRASPACRARRRPSPTGAPPSSSA